MSALGGIYGSVARARRAWYQPCRQRRLNRPVISIGNLAVGGSGKTPVVAAVVRVLQELGEHPAILSRGYGRRSGTAVRVVSNGNGPIVDVTDSGDEPFLLARTLAGAGVVVGADRHAAGLLAENQLGATVHVLDDGFQHVTLFRDLDMVLVAAADLHDRVLPDGRLREPVEAASSADALLVTGSSEEHEQIRAVLQVASSFTVRSESGPLRRLSSRDDVLPTRPRRVVAVAGIARPERFFASVRTAGFDVARELSFRDHHWFDHRDIHRIEEAALAVDAPAIVTTEKDAVRLMPSLSGRVGVADWVYLPYSVHVEPDETFRSWLSERLATARQPRDTRPA